MDWKHKCSLDWLRERQKYLTASEIKKLLPVTATGRKRSVTDLDRFKVLSGKMVELTEEDTWSYGAAARGHLLEPYAVEALNDVLRANPKTAHEKFNWWDDELVSVPGRAIAFSPDAMNVPMTSNEAPSAIAEVKCYSAEKHLALAYTPKDKIEERWQIATAMALLPDIDYAYLVLFNPKLMGRALIVIRFDRHELETEIGIILDVEMKWRDFLSSVHTKKSPNGAVYSWYTRSEEEIAKEILNMQGLNPV